MAGRPLSRRMLQLGYVVAGLGLVVVGDLMAGALATLWGAEPAVVARIGARVIGGWAVGTALRLELARRAKPEPGLRWLLAGPLGLVAGWPLLLALLPGGVLELVPAVLRGATAQGLAPFAGAALGVVLALAVRRRRG
ncbi:hypothetical protein ER308_04885 [Egibacter rhizosphaerae]|uniref:Uncharacterized protein n=1 Tax=Egibacter rhizosphaerae TaxID=1670831 RepID=A0A411YCG6_9ACTN|nr:hypothetical protein [Egibacter rhizosphaerae]QBI18943.1 hypothetical protein ER308_04885 [Egibacter rhizosphaerae]